jgi:hypothetical protein
VAGETSTSPSQAEAIQGGVSLPRVIGEWEGPTLWSNVIKWYRMILNVVVNSVNVVQISLKAAIVGKWR